VYNAHEAMVCFMSDEVNSRMGEFKEGWESVSFCRNTNLKVLPASVSPSSFLNYHVIIVARMLLRYLRKIH